MKKIIIILFLIVLLFSQTRKPEVAGQFYTADAKKLKATIQFYLDQEKVQSSEKPIGIIAPHAGYVYSGHVASAAYKQIQNHQFDAIVVLSPSHRIGFDYISIYNGDFYETPLGKIPVDKSLAKSLVTEDNDIMFSDIGHLKKDVFTMGEHALEIQLPFIQMVQKNVKIIPIVIGTQSYQKIELLGKRLMKLRNNHNILIVASSDLSHFHDYEACKQIDKKLINAVKTNEPKSFYKNLNKNKYEACGGSCITALMIATGEISEIKILKYANSGDIQGGDKNSVVGYLSAAFYEGKEKEMSENLLTIDEQKMILKLAEESVKYYVNGLEAKVPENIPPIAKEKRGAFVTLHKNDQLRGCIGYILPIKPLYETIIEMAEAAALRDPRFNPVTPKELDDVDVEVSVLTIPRVIEDVNVIEVGKHGIIISQGYQQGLLLPQVATEYGWNRETFLKHTCNKAGLPTDAWKNKNTEIKIFSAQVFNRESLGIEK